MAIADYGLDYFKMASSTEKDLSGYYRCTAETEGALQVVDDSVSEGSGKIKISNVTPYKSRKTLEVGDYVVKVTLAIGSYIDFSTIK